jgi:hypothetical protein
MITANFTPVSHTEKMLSVMPKKCNCPMCRSTKKRAQSELGKKRYKEITKILGLAA